MKKDYEAPKAELLEFDYTDTAVASSSGQKADLGGVGVVSAGGWLCDTREVDTKNVQGTVCGYDENWVEH